MQMTKKVLSIVLSVLMVVSMMSVMAVATANAADFSSDVKTIFLTDAQGWDSAGIPYVHYWKEDTSYPAPSYTAVTTTVDNNDWVQMSWLFDNSLGQSVYGVNIPDDANKVEFNVDSGNNGKQTSVTSNVYDGSWWYVDANKDCQICTTSAYDTTGQALSLSAAFVDNTGADRYFVLDGRYYYRHSSTNAIKQYNNDSELMVAEIVGGAHGGEKFTDVNDAVKAAGNNGTVMLINDIKSNVNISEKCNTTLDLNGHTITNTSGSGITLGSVYSNPVTFTIKDTSAAQTGRITINKKYAGDGCISDSSGRKVVIEGGTYTSDANALYVSSDEGWEIKGGTFNGDVKVISALDVTGGAINGDINATGPSWTVDPAEVTISGGTVNGDLNSTNGSTFEVSGGTFTSDVSAYTTRSTYQNANGEVVAKAANTIYDDGDFATAAAEGGDWYIVADVNGDGVTVTSNLKIWNTDKDHTIAGDITVANGKSIAKGGKKKVTFTGTTTLDGGSVSDANFTEIIVANDPYVHGQINNVPSGAVIKNGDGDRIVYDAISLAYAAKNGSEVYLVDDISDMYMTMNVNSGNFVLHGDDHTVNFTFKGDYASAIGKDASIAIDDLTVTVASGKALKSFIKANAADDNAGTVTINDVSATGFSTDNVYTGGGTWTFTGATVTSATQPECPEDWKAVDNNDGTWSIVAKVYVAQVGENKYETLDEAVADAISSGNDIYLLAACNKAPNNAFSKLTVTGSDPVVFVVRGNGFYGASFAAKTDIANGAYVNTWTISGTGKNAVYTYTIKPATVMVTRANGDVIYPTSLVNALNGMDSVCAKEGDTVTLLSNLTWDSAKVAIPVKYSGVTLDLNGNTLTGEKENFLQVKNDNTLTIENGTIVNTAADIVVGEGSTLNLDGATVGNINAGAGAEITFDNGAGITGDVDVPAGYKVVTDATTGTKTVVAMNLQDLAAAAFTEAKTAGLGFVDSTTLSGIDVPAKASILGVQLRQAPVDGEYDEGNGTNALRFITAVDKNFLQNQDITDYGYLITVRNTTRFQTCKNTTNTTLKSGADDDLEYFTAAIYNIPDGNAENIKVQFVFKTAGNDHAAFATYKNAGQYELNTNYKDVYKHFNS